MVAKAVWALGLMSGTSLDGIDAALIRTDGEQVFERGAWLVEPLPDALRQEIRHSMHDMGDWLELEKKITLLHVEAVKKLLHKAGMSAKDISVIGFHGQTITHRPKEQLGFQLGNGALLAEKTRINVVNDFRRRDLAAGGEGAPLVPLYHAALVAKMDLPLAVLNIGGIANVTWIGCSENVCDRLLEHDIIAFDTGAGNVLLNEWAYATYGLECDEGGRLAAAGQVDEEILAKYLAHPFFLRHPPKSLDRNDFNIDLLKNLSAEDAAATLVAFTAESIQQAQAHFPAPVSHWLVAGGGRHNPTIMQALRTRLGKVEPVESVGWEGDALEAQAFAYLAVRSMLRLPLSLPTTTGANRAVTGGAFYGV